jgi:hypothetical protein
MWINYAAKEAMSGTIIFPMLQGLDFVKYFLKSAEGGTRTRKPVTALPPQSSVYTSFTTSAIITIKNIAEALENQLNQNLCSDFFSLFLLVTT